MHFSDFNLNTNVLDALKKMQFITPTDIQSKAIPLLMQEGTDLIARAQTGTGKTAAFGIPLLHKIDPSLHSIQAVILSPTRELEEFPSIISALTSSLLDSYVNCFYTAAEARKNKVGSK